ncbi:MAG: ATP-binding protein [Elainellaceae cyanobacterium]
MEITRSLQRILLIDDNPNDRLLAIREIRQAFPDVHIHEALDWPAIKQAFAADNFDLMITDYELNWATGIEVLHALKAHDPNRPVIMFTDSGSQEIAVEAMKAGLDDYVLKSPKHLIRLSQAVRSVWNNAQIRCRARELEVQLQFLLNELEVGVFRATPEGQLLDASDGLLQLLGFASISDAQPFFQNQLAWNSDSRQDQKRWQREIKLDRAGRERPLWLQVSETVVEMEGRSVVDGLISDVTARKETEAALQALNRTLEERVHERTMRLEHLNQELEAFAFSVSHELRAPIRQIDGFTMLLQEQIQAMTSDETVLHYLHTVGELTNRSGKMIDDLLLFSRTGRAQMQVTPVDMGYLVQEIKRQVEPDLVSRSIDWQIHPLPRVEGDRNLLRQVWQNLIENAVKYTGERERAKIIVNATSGDGEIIFSVGDNGIGFDDEDARKNLFGVFNRLANAENFKGTGIGLANVQKIVSRHGGRCWAEGAVGEGATVYFTIPVSLKPTEL